MTSRYSWATNPGMRITFSTMLLLAVLCQAFIPAGFMPGAGTATMVICSGMGQKIVTVDENGQPAEDSRPPGCAFAAFLAFASVPPPALPLPHAIELASIIPGLVASDRPAAFHHPAQPQGPPAFA